MYHDNEIDKHQYCYYTADGKRWMRSDLACGSIDHIVVPRDPPIDFLLTGKRWMRSDLARGSIDHIVVPRDPPIDFRTLLHCY